jgi:DNA-binding response OmpR family regulator
MRTLLIKDDTETAEYIVAGLQTEGYDLQLVAISGGG